MSPGCHRDDLLLKLNRPNDRLGRSLTELVNLDLFDSIHVCEYDHDRRALAGLLDFVPIANRKQIAGIYGLTFFYFDIERLAFQFNRIKPHVNEHFKSAVCQQSDCVFCRKDVRDFA